MSGTRGPLTQTSTHVLAQIGTPRPAAPPRPARKLTTGLRCPTWLDDVAKTYWKRITRELQAQGLVFNVDQEAMAVMAQTWANWRTAVMQVRREGITYETVNQAGSTMTRKNPAVDVMNENARLLLTYLREFGLTPAARARIEIPESASKPDGASDGAEDVIGRSKQQPASTG